MLVSILCYVSLLATSIAFSPSRVDTIANGKRRRLENRRVDVRSSATVPGVNAPDSQTSVTVPELSAENQQGNVTASGSAGMAPPWIKCFGEHNRQVYPVDLAACHLAQDYLIREPDYLQPQKWSHVPPRPGTRGVPLTWPPPGIGGNCEITLDASMNIEWTFQNRKRPRLIQVVDPAERGAIETLRLLDISVAARRILEECPMKSTSKSRLGGLVFVGHDSTFFVSVNGRPRHGSTQAPSTSAPELGARASLEAPPGSISTSAPIGEEPVHCFVPEEREIVTLSVHDCHVALELLIHESDFLTVQRWSHRPARPGTHEVPDHWPYGNCDIIVTCGRNTAK